MHEDETARGARPGPSSVSGPGRDLAAALAALDHPGARRRFRTAEPGDPGGRDAPLPLADLLTPVAVAARRAADPVATLAIEELTGSMALHAVAAPLVDLVVGLLVVGGVVLDVEPSGVLLRFDGTAVAEVAVPAGVAVAAAGPAGPDRLAGWLVEALDPLVALVEPVDEPLRWGAVADLVAVLAQGRARAHGLDVDRTWALADAVVAGLRVRRPHPSDAPSRLAVEGPDGADLALARRCSCCQWHRAARQLGEPSVADARCADCPSLDPEANVARLTALAAAGDLAAP